MAIALDDIVDRSCAPEHVQARLRARASAKPSQLRRSMIIVYATLAACVLLTPRQIAEHLRSAEPNAVVDLGARAMTRVDALSQRLGAQQAFDRARGRFLDGPFPPSDKYRLRAALAP